MAKTVALIGTLDTKGPEIAYLRDRCQDLGLKTLVVDSGILGRTPGVLSHTRVHTSYGRSSGDVRRSVDLAQN